MHRLNQLYAEYFNWRHHRVGQLFQGRFKSFLVDTDTHFREVARYVVLNPVRARMRKTAGGYKWSTAGLAKPVEWVATDELLDAFDCFDKENARKLYREFVAAGKRDDDLMAHVASQLVLGSESYIARIREFIDEKRHRTASTRWSSVSLGDQRSMPSSALSPHTARSSRVPSTPAMAASRG